MVKKIFMIVIMIICFNPSLSVFGETNENAVYGILNIKVMTTISPSQKQSTPINNARIVVINSGGEIISTELTNSNGEATIAVSVPKDSRFPMKNMGEVTVIAIANGYNEHIDFSVPINEYNDNTGRVTISLWQIDPNRRNEPQFLHGSFHRLTVFEMLDYYANKLGLKRQNIKEKSISPAPWGPKFALLMKEIEII
ncbi:hypothetical protein KHA93_00495 [Bacillus sp. FJAT-49732]|uniref:Carboxypeptidase regulatory-like domain-containing protein n=1 Tax=Lederbergia citrisecunda TaxID=2833583 RepID=A0A942YJ06_9BACI|nr:carboxypeptidase-like regulatory domain-containing protein [Lederbergia citrisecunda]MBS4198137.1 hypothetical protein [Lederbergia citrisecunda]